MSSSASHELNVAFTDGMIRPLAQHIAATGVENLSIPDGTFFLNGTTAELYEPYSDFPSIFTHAENRLVFQPSMPTDVFGGTLHVTVGNYGEKWAQVLLRATRSLIDGAVVDPSSPVSILPETRIMNATHQALLNTHTYRQAVGEDDFDTLLDFGPRMSFTEGMETILFCVAIFSHYIPKGYEHDPLRLLTELANSGLFSRYSLAVPAAITAQMGNDGIVFTKMPFTKSHGRFVLEKEIQDHFTDERDEAYEDFTTEAAEPLDIPGCPVGRRLRGSKQSGIDIMANLLAQTVGEIIRREGITF